MSSRSSSSSDLRFPAFEDDPHFETLPRHRPSHQSSASNKSSIAAIFHPREINVVDIEMGVFGHKSYEHMRSQNARGRKCWLITVVIFTVLGVLAWAAAIAVIVRESA